MMALSERFEEALQYTCIGGKEGTLWYYRSLANTFQQYSAATKLIDELNRTVTAIEEIAGS